jgi:hypothetical protein
MQLIFLVASIARFAFGKKTAKAGRRFCMFDQSQWNARELAICVINA